MSAAKERRVDLSVIVPTHNVGLWIQECLSSILSDQASDAVPFGLEVIVVDDGSTDGTWQIVSGVAERDPRVRLVRAAGEGGGAARNQGVELAQGDFLAFVDGDDLVPRGSYAAMLASARASGAQMVVGPFLKFFIDKVWAPAAQWSAFDEGRVGVTLADQPSALRNRACWNRIFRRDFWLEAGITFPSAVRSNDIVPMTRALLGATFDVVDRFVYIYRDRPGISSMTAKAASVEGLVSYFEQELECARLVVGQVPAQVEREYAEMVLLDDGWVHVMRFLDTVGADPADSERLAELVAEVLTVLAADLADILPAPRAWVWGLAAENRWAEAATLAPVMGRKSVEAPDPRLLLDSAARLWDRGLVPAAHIADIVERRLVDLATSVSGSPYDDGMPAVVAAHSALFRDLFGDGRPLKSSARRFVAAAAGGDAGAVRAASTPSLKARARATLTTFARRAAKAAYRARRRALRAVRRVRGHAA